MLKELHIRNFALIDKLDIDFESGFSVITGETGAGKSIVLGAIGLLMGQRADTKAIKTDAQKCSIEANFNLSAYDMKEWFDENEIDFDDEDCIIRRELTASGKSRGFINDTPATVHQMKELGEMLMDVHSQHQNLLLQKEDFQLNTVDIIAHNTKERTEYVKVFNEFHAAQKALEELKKSISENRKNEEFMRFQLDELIAANLIVGEQEELEQEQESASHTEDIKSALYEADTLLNGDNNDIIGNLKQVCNSIESISSVFPQVEEISERLESAYIEIKDIASDINNKLDDVEFDPERLEFINDRLDTLYSLQKKYSKSNIAELIEERDRLQQAIDTIDNSDEELKEHTAKVALLQEKTQQLADTLTKTRTKAANTVEEEIHKRLTALGMPNVQFAVELTCNKSDDSTHLTKDGQDKIAFMFSANKGMALRPVSQVASGGEIARVMLSLKAMISGAVKLPTIIFDEIDTGVSGKMAEKMADIMKEMGEANRQVISITHLPQIAAKGSCHYKVEKHDTENGTTSLMRRLNDEERVQEIAQMLSGENITDAALTNAKELLKNK